MLSSLVALILYGCEDNAGGDGGQKPQPSIETGWPPDNGH